MISTSLSVIDDKEKGGLSPMVMWIIIGSISGVTVIVVIIVTVILCRRRMTDADRKKKRWICASRLDQIRLD